MVETLEGECKVETDLPIEKMDYVVTAIGYCEDVLSGKIIACEYVKLACQRQLNDLENPPEGYKFSAYFANRVCLFAESQYHIKGEWAGREIDLEPWQIFILTTLFGWVTIEQPHYRRFKTAYTEVSRKNAKSTLSSTVALYLLAADGEGGAEVYSAATAKDQAKIVWKDAKRMVERNVTLREKFGIHTSAHSVEQFDTSSIFLPLARDQGGNLDGLNVHGAIIDELHGHKTRDVWDVIETATGSRKQPLVWAITTAGFNRTGICYEQRDYIVKVLKGIVNDDEYFGIIFTLDKGDDWKDEAVWLKANPNLGVSVSLEDLRRKARKATEQAAAQNNFLTKHMDMWVNAATAWMNVSKWDECGNSELVIEDFAEWECNVAVDLASKSDIASVSLLFYRAEEYALFVRNYVPQETVEESKNSQYEGWVKEGFLTATPGNTTDYKIIEDDIVELAEKLNVLNICFDPFQATYISTRLVEKGLPVFQYGNTVKNMSEPMKELERLVLSRRLVHADNPVLNWMISNVTAKEDTKENIFPRKEFPENKIDGVIAAIMALGKRLSDENEEESVYANRGVVSVG